MDPERDPGEDSDEDRGQVRLEDVVTIVTLQPEGDAQTVERAYRYIDMTLMCYLLN